MPRSYSPAGAAGSNKLVGKPSVGGVIQRRARPCPTACALPWAEQRFERPLHRARARAERQGQRRTRPRLAIRQQRQHLGVRLLRQRRQHRDVAPARVSRKPPSTASMPASGPKRLAQPADLDAQPRAMRFVGVSGAEGARQQFPRVAAPGQASAERAQRARTAPAGFAAPPPRRPRRPHAGRRRSPARPRRAAPRPRRA